MRALYEFARDNKDVFLLDVVGSDGREVSGDPMRYFTPEEACAHRAVLRLRPRLSYHEDEYFEIDAHDGASCKQPGSYVRCVNVALVVPVHRCAS
jgi:hypothetical protein